MKYYGKLLSVTELQPDQRTACNATRPIALSGQAGTGKSIISIHRHIAYLKSKQTSLLLTYTKTLESYFVALIHNSHDHSAFNENIVKKNYYISRTYKFVYGNGRMGSFNHMIIDEAQDVELSCYDMLSQYAINLSYGIDNEQSLYQSKEKPRATEEELAQKFNNLAIRLSENHRNTKRTVKFVQWVLNGKKNFSTRTSVKTPIGNKPILIQASNQQKLNIINELIFEYKNERTNIGIICDTQDQSSLIHEFLNQKAIEHSFYIQNDEIDHFDLFNIHVCTSKSAKGLEFDMVIIPFFNLKQYINQPENEYNRNMISAYYVAMTRTRGDLYIMINSIDELSYLDISNASDYCEIK